jgi:nucleotide-binding universal stress UspA family protein
MKILVGYNGSESSVKAMKQAQKEAEMFKAQIVVAKIVDFNHELKYTDFSIMEDELEREARSIFSTDKTPFETHIIPTKKRAGRELVEYARYYGADEIVIGMSKRSRVGKFLFNSDVQQVILESPCPVVTVK